MKPEEQIAIATEISAAFYTFDRSSSKRRKLLDHLIKGIESPPLLEPDEKVRAVHGQTAPLTDKFRDAVRQLIDRLKRDLEGYAYSPRSRQARYRLHIEDQTHRPFVEPQQPSVKKLFESLFSNPVRLVHTEPQFFRMADGRVLVRHLDVNSERALRGGADADAVQQRTLLLNALPGCDVAAMSACREYVSSGEVSCILALTRLFESVGVTTTTISDADAYRPDDDGANLVVLGNNRTSPRFAQLQRRLNFQSYSFGMRNLSPLGGEPDTFADLESKDGSTRRLHVLVSRFRSRSSGSQWVLLIGAHRSSAFRRVAERITTEKGIESWLEDIAQLSRRADPEEFDDQFELVLGFDVDGGDEAVGHGEVLAYRKVTKGVGKGTASENLLERASNVEFEAPQISNRRRRRQ